MQSYSNPAIAWGYPLFTHRALQANCEVIFDFDWTSTIGHKYPKFRGLQDLSLAISEFAKRYKKTPLLLLSDKCDVPFDEMTTEALYVAVVNIGKFLNCTQEHDRSAMFFLEAFSNHGNGVTVPGGVMPIRVHQLLKALERELEGRSEVLVEALRRGGATLTLGLLEAAIKGLEKCGSREHLETLTEIFAESPAAAIADAAYAARRRLACDQFQTLLNEDANEHKFQPWFVNNAWVLGSDCVRVLDGRQIDVRNIADLLVEAYDGHADIVELKRPRLGFWRETLDHGNHVPHQDLVAAIVQAQHYQFALEGEINSNKTRDRLSGVAIAKPASLLVYGRSIGWNAKQFEAQRLLNGGLSSLRVVTYDQVLRRAITLMGRHADKSAALGDVSRAGPALAQHQESLPAR